MVKAARRPTLPRPAAVAYAVEACVDDKAHAGCVLAAPPARRQRRRTDPRRGYCRKTQDSIVRANVVSNKDVLAKLPPRLRDLIGLSLASRRASSISISDLKSRDTRANGRCRKVQWNIRSSYCGQHSPPRVCPRRHVTAITTSSPTIASPVAGRQP